MLRNTIISFGEVFNLLQNIKYSLNDPVLIFTTQDD